MKTTLNIFERLDDFTPLRSERPGPPFLAKLCRFDEKTGGTRVFLTDPLAFGLNAFRRQNSRRAARVINMLSRESQNAGACRVAVDFQ